MNTEDKLKFWREIYVAAIRSGKWPDDAEHCANRAIIDISSFISKCIKEDGYKKDVS